MTDNYWDIVADTTAGNFGFSIKEATTPRIVIEPSTGNIGIGTDNPDSKLHIEGTGETNLTLEGSSASIGCYLLLKNKNTSANSSTTIQGLDGSGQGISEVKFISSDDSNNEGFITLSTRPASGSLTERLRITSAGAINIGTGAESSTSSNLLEMYVGPTDDSYATIRGKYNRSNEYNRSEVRFGVESNASGKGFLAFATGTNSATERVRITSTGELVSTNGTLRRDVSMNHLQLVVILHLMLEQISISMVLVIAVLQMYSE